jgi:hypothetical protein
LILTRKRIDDLIGKISTAGYSSARSEFGDHISIRRILSKRQEEYESKEVANLFIVGKA